MTRDEFIDGYIARSNGNGAGLRRVEGGYELAGQRYRHVALPCACGADVCPGWAMVTATPDEIAMHVELHGPKPATPPAVDTAPMEGG